MNNSGKGTNQERYLIVDIYARLSKPKKNKYGEDYSEVEGNKGAKKYNRQTELSLERQIHECRKRIAENPMWREGVVFQEVYTGPEIRNRAELTKARKRWINGQCDIFLVYNSDRLARGRAMTVLTYEMREYGVEFKSITERDLGDTPEDDLINDIRAHVSESERLKLIERVKSKLHQRAEQGKIHGSVPLYGYCFDASHSTYEIDETEAENVRLMYDLRYHGLSIRRITRFLIEQGILTRTGKMWGETVVSSILRNPFYIGHATANKQTYEYEHCDGRVIRHRRPHPHPVKLPEGTVPAIVTKDLYYAVQGLLDEGIRFSPRRLQNPENYLLRSGFARCAYCGAALIVKRNKPTKARSNGRVYPRNDDYICPNRTRPNVSCPGPSINTPLLDSITWEFLGKELEDLSTIQAVLTLIAEDSKHVDDIESYGRDIIQREARLKTLFEEYETTPPGELRSLMRQRLSMLSEDLEAKKKERENLIPKAQADALWQQEVNHFLTWAAKMKACFPQATYQEKIRALRVLGVKVFLAKVEDPSLPRYDVQLSLRSLYADHAGRP